MKRTERIAQLAERLGRLITNGEHADGFKPVQWETLRYLNQANVFSRNPGSLAQYLGVTKGSVSQTLSTLEQRGLVRKRTDEKDKRVVRLELTPAGRRQVAADPLRALSSSIGALDGGQQREAEAALEAILRTHLTRLGRQAFGQCRDCRHLRKNKRQYRCGLLDEPLELASTKMICAEFEVAGQ